MRVFGAVTEFNPFHNGHAHLLGEAKRQGADFTVCVMSGEFVQRGEPAVCSKWARAEAAVQCGADLVIELPVSFSASCAERFAFGSVYLLESLGIVDTLIFGSEGAGGRAIYEAARLMSTAEFEEAVAKELKTGVSYPRAREQAAEKLFGANISKILSCPNQLLALEYCRALIELGSSMTAIAVKRCGAQHDDKASFGSFASASLLRSNLEKDIELLREFMPPASFEILKREYEKGFTADYRGLTLPVLSFFRRAGAEDIARLPDVSEGLEHRIKSAALTAASLEELISAVKTKRYTHARLRRIVLSSYLGFEKDMAQKPEYIRVLAVGEGGRELLRRMRKTAKLPIIMKYSDASSLSEEGKKMFEQENLASDLYGLLCRSIRPCGDNQTHNVYINKIPKGEQL